MKDHITDLDILEKKYQETIRELEAKIEEAKRKLNVISEAIKLLRKEGIFEQNKLFQPPEIIDNQYGKMSMKESIVNILSSNENASVEIVYDGLVKHGFKTKSKNLKRDVYSRLFRMEQAGFLTSIKEGRIKKYSLSKKTEEKEHKEIENEKGLTLVQ